MGSMRTLQYLTQRNSSCGQLSLAMVMGISYKEACAAFGRTGVTFSEEYPAAVAKLGGVSGGQWVPIENSSQLPALGLVRIKFFRKGSYKTFNRIGHMIAVCDGWVYDPSFGRPAAVAEYVQCMFGKAVFDKCLAVSVG